MSIGVAGVSPRVLRIEVRRVLRNRRTIVFSVVMPVVFFALLTTDRSAGNAPVGTGNHVASVMISMALYGAVLSSTGCGAAVCLDRAAGWAKTLAITPMGSVTYLLIRTSAASMLSLVPIAAVYLCGLFGRSAAMPLSAWLTSATILWVSSMLFAVFGLAVGLTLPIENVTQVLTFLVMTCAFAGGLFFPIDQMGARLTTWAQWTPLFGLDALVHAPLLAQVPSAGKLMNVLGWLAVFSALAMWRLRRGNR